MRRVRDILVVFIHVVVTWVRLSTPGGFRSVVSESVLVRHQLLILNRGRKRSSDLRVYDSVIAGLCSFLMRPGACSQIRDHSEAINTTAFPQNAGQAQIPGLVFPQTQKSTRSERAGTATHRRRPCNETTQSGVGCRRIAQQISL